MDRQLEESEFLTKAGSAAPGPIEVQSQAPADDRVELSVIKAPNADMITVAGTTREVASIAEALDHAGATRESTTEVASPQNFFLSISAIQDVVAELIVVDVVRSSALPQSEQIAAIQELLVALETSVAGGGVDAADLRWQFTGDGMIAAFIHAKAGIARTTATDVSSALADSRFRYRILIHGGKCLDVSTADGPDHITGSAVSAACLMLDAIDSDGLFMTTSYFDVFEGGFGDTQISNSRTSTVVTKHGAKRVVFRLPSPERDRHEPEGRRYQHETDARVRTEEFGSVDVRHDANLT